jgi:outer membrane protein assembly factor BamD (BamD/ComL family)
LLDQARAALKRGDAAVALSALDQRQAEVGAGMLGPEATVTRVEALLGQGNRDAASGLAERFWAEHPRGVHADRLRSLLGGARP